MLEAKKSQNIQLVLGMLVNQKPRRIETATFLPSTLSISFVQNNKCFNMCQGSATFLLWKGKCTACVNIHFKALKEVYGR
jgi:hypothetical protein